MLTDFIHRYEGVFSKEDCSEIIDYIHFLENDGCMFYDKSRLHLEDHITKKYIKYTQIRVRSKFITSYC